MSAPISRGSLAYSCRMSVASAHTRRNVMRSRPGDTKAFVLISASTSGGLRQIDRTDNLLLAVILTRALTIAQRHPDCSLVEAPQLQEAHRRPVLAHGGIRIQNAVVGF